MAAHSGFRFLKGMMGPESPQSSPLAAPRPQHCMGIRKSGYAPRFQVPARYDGPREPPKFPFGRPLDPSIAWGFGNRATHSGFRFLQGMMGPESPKVALWPAPRPQHCMGIRKSGYAPRFQVPARYDGPREPQKFPFGRPLDPSIAWRFGNLATHSGFRFLQV